MEASRKAKKHSRSKTGCSQCKHKRLKCDETKPSCLQCRKRRVRCPGYQRQIRWVADYQNLGGRAGNASQQPVDKAAGPAPRQATAAEDSDRDASSDSRFPTSVADTLGYGNPKPACTTESELGSTILTESSPCRVSMPFQYPATASASAVPPENPSAHVEDGEPPINVFGFARSQGQVCNANDAAIGSPSPDWPLSSDSGLGLIPSLADGESETQNSVVERLTSESLGEEDKFLLHHYFTNVCRLNSAFDSPTNPFRYMIAELIVDSPLIMNCVLSISARWEVQRNERFLSTAVHRHSAAVGHLYSILLDIRQRDESVEHGCTPPSPRHEYHQIKHALLASILLGISSSWLDSSDNGMQHLLGARRLFAKWQSTHTDDDGSVGGPWAPSAALCDPDKSFVIGALAYWEALLAFVVDQSLDSLDYLKPFCEQSSLDMVRLNPWSGICTPVFIYLGQVGILARQRRLSLRMQLMGWSTSYNAVFRDLLSAASTVERRIIEYQVPPKSKTCDTGDPTTSLTDLENYARCYQIASLLELYRSFPELVSDRELVDGPSAPCHFTSSPPPPHVDAGDLRQSPKPKQAQRMLLLDMATKLMWLMESAPKNCGISTGHTLAIIICGSVLHSIPEDAAPGGSKNPTVYGLLNSVVASPAVITRWRESLRERIRSNSRITGLRSFEQVEQLLDAIWARVDAACDLRHSSSDDPLDVHWLDIMAECKLETVYG